MTNMGVVTVVAEAADSRVVPVLCSSDTTRHHSKLYVFRPKKSILDRKLKIYWSQTDICALLDCLNPTFLGRVLAEFIYLGNFLEFYSSQYVCA